jgi:hypothetical protein
MSYNLKISIFYKIYGTNKNILIHQYVGEIDIFSFNLIQKITVMYVTTCMCICVSLLT